MIQEQNINRAESAQQLLDDFELRQDAEFFSNPAHRLEFLESLDYEDFFSITQHVNARMRGFEPRDGKTKSEKGAYLPMMKTPSATDKPLALEMGFNTIQQYLHESEDGEDQKIIGVGMAVEALVVWVHPFNDGNGRTSRFLGKFIEDGTSNIDQLSAAAVDRNERPRMYPEFLRVDDTTDLSNEDIILDDDEVEEIKRAQEKLPIAEGISMSLKRLLEDKTLQQRVEAASVRNQEVRRTALARTVLGN